MASGYGPVLLDFSPLGRLGETFFRARDEAEDRQQKRALRQSLAALSNGQVDYGTMGRTLLAHGDLRGVEFLKLDQAERKARAQEQADRQALGVLGGGVSAPSYAPSAGTPRTNIDRNTVHVAETEEDVQRLERATGQHLWDEDKDAVVRTVYGEASGEGPVGQAAVAGVIANRARQSGMTPKDVVLAQGQFEPWSDPAARARMQNLDPNSPTYRQVAANSLPVVQGQAPDPTGGADHFYAPRAQAALGRNAPSWDDGSGVDIGNHRFFRHGYGPRGPVQVAQADIPAAGARNAQGFIVPGQGANALIASLERALANPRISDPVRRSLERRLDRAYKERDEVQKQEAEAPTTRQIKQPDGSEVVVQWDRQSRQWVPMPAPEGGSAVRGPGKLTEQQSKDVGFYNRGAKIIDRLDQQDKALTDTFSAVGGNVSNFLKTPAYRQAEQTGREFLAVILRKDTGAAVTPQEFEMYGSIYLPKPGDDDATIKQKQAARRTALEGIRMGLGPAEILFQSQEAAQSQQQTQPSVAPPPAAIDYLRQNPSLRREFDQKYGPGSSARALGIPDA